MPKLIVITGPTATGKTALSVKVAKALDGEIVSSDSMQIYKGMDIGTAKVTAAEMQDVPHYMLDVAEPTKRFTVSDYAQMALPIIEDIISRKKTPIIVGGTGLYINSILFEITFGGGDLELENQVKEQLQGLNKDELWVKLNEVNPERAAQLFPNDVKRIKRALELYYMGGDNATQSELDNCRYDADIYVLSGDRQEIYDRINRRVNLMYNNGLIDEVQRLIEKGSDRYDQSFGAIAYKETCIYLNNEISYESLLELVKQRSRNYAKRQLTWCRKYYPEAVWLDYKEQDKNLAMIIEKYKNE